WAGISGMTLFFVFALLINFATYWFSDKIVLAIYRAKPISQEDEPKLYKIVDALSEEMKIPKPKLYIVDSPAPNAFATGRSPKHSSMAIMSGLMKHLDYDEIEGVLAH